MNRGAFLVFILTISTAMFAFSMAQAETVYPPQTPDHYLPMPLSQQPASDSSTLPALSSSGVAYSSDQYPTAQGQFLKVPSGYQAQAAQPQQASYRPVAPAPAPVLTVPKDVEPAPPLTVSSGYVATLPTPQPIITPAASAPQIYVAPKPTPVSYPQAASTTAAVPTAQPVTPTSYQDMPTYTYSPSTDPAHPPYKTPLARDPKAFDNSLGLGTLSGFQVGLGVSGYRYQEFDPSGAELIRITGPTFSITLDGTKAYKDGWFYSGDLRLSYGSHDYTGGDVNTMTGVVTPSTQSSIPDLMFDLRALVGHDFLIQDAFWGAADIDLAPYSGLGFRFLYEDNTGEDSNGVPGYERFSHYIYLPIGFTPRFRLTEQSRLSLNMEYDILIHGWQTSALGDSNPGESDVTDDQNTGFGLRGSVMYERRDWSVGPFFEFWDIGQSTTDCSNASCGFEPHNQTYESGIVARYRF